MRVLQVTDYGSPFAGSFVPMLRSAAEAAEERGWRFGVVLPARAASRDWLGQLDGVDVIFAPAVRRRELTAWLAELAGADGEPTILHSHFTVFDLPAVRVAAARPHTTVYWHVHTVLGSSSSIRLRNRVKLALASRRVELILCVAEHLAESVRARGAPAAKVRYFPNAIDVDSHHPASPEERRAARRKLGIPEDATVLLHFGRQWELKGGDLFLAAFKQLREAGHDDLVALCSRGGEPASEQAAALGVADSTVIVQHVPDTQDLYSAADILMATSRAEGMPLTVLEALASGLLVVASDIPGHALPDAPRGDLSIAPLDPQGLAAAAAAFLEAPPAPEDRTGPAWTRANFGMTGWGGRLMDLYEGAGDP